MKLWPITLMVTLVFLCDSFGAAPDRIDFNSKSKENQRNQYGYAVWYPVPRNSLARRRARGLEFTAAHNRLPLGTLVRVTRLSNGKTVLVRITDRGITNRRANIDVCREAAEALDMIQAGFVRVRLEVVPDVAVATANGQSDAAAH